MGETFQQLLKEYPKSAAAAQAHYYIGKSAFEAKDYATAITELKTARELNPEQYGDSRHAPHHVLLFLSEAARRARAGSGCSFSETSPNGQVPAEILEWLGLESYNAKNYAAAAKYLTALSKSGERQQRANRTSGFISATRR